MDQKPFGDWRIRLGITCAIILFAMGVITYSLLEPTVEGHHQEAWWTIRITLLAMLGASVASDALTRKKAE